MNYMNHYPEAIDNESSIDDNVAFLGITKSVLNRATSNLGDVINTSEDEIKDSIKNIKSVNDILEDGEIIKTIFVLSGVYSNVKVSK